MNLDKTIDNLKNRGYDVVYIEKKEDALNTIISYISKEDLLGFGGSMTINQIGLFDYLLENNYNILNRYEKGLTPDQVFDIERKSLLSDIYITSTNAISQTGELVNIDGKSNRVAAQIFGPKKVFLITGTNKICDSLEEAVARAQEYAAPLNAKRFEEHITTPCMKDGVCRKCSGPMTICKTVVTMRRAASLDRTTIFLINDNLGF